MAHRSRRMGTAVAVALAVIVLVGGSGPAASTVRPATPTFAWTWPTWATDTASPAVVAAAMDEYLSDLVRRHQFRGTVLVARGDDVLFSAGYGLADESTGEVNTAHTRFRIGSVTKQFTALAILKLQELGRLAVTDRVCRHVTPCPAAWGSITIEHLLTHTSGIRDYSLFGDFPVFRTTAMSAEHLIGLFRDKTTDFAPGTRFSYSNSGYALLGYIIERVTGGTYGEFLRRQILVPLGLSETGYGLNQASRPGHAVGYWGWDDRSADPIDVSVGYSAGAMFSSATDLYHWNRYLSTRTLPIVNADTLNQMLTPRVSFDPRQAPELGTYGYGLAFTGPPAQRWYIHGGGETGFPTFNAFRPDQQVSITVLTNMEFVDLDLVADKLTAIVAPPA